MEKEIAAFFSTWSAKNEDLLNRARQGRAEIVHGTTDNPTTQADLSLHEGLSGLFARLAPWPVFSEEAADGNPQLPEDGFFWLIDPIDGTREFALGISECVSSIALVDGRTGTPLFGVIHNLYENRTHSTLGGLNPVVAGTPRPALLWSRSEQKLGLEPYLKPLQSIIERTIPTGSIAYKIFRCALEPESMLTVSLQPKSLWDIAGAAAFVQHVPGLRLTDLSGRALSLRGRLSEKVNGIVCSHERWHERIVQDLRNAGALEIGDLRKAKAQAASASAP